MIEDKDDTFLARWLNGDLSQEELKAFESSSAYAKYQKILLGTEQIVPQSLDTDKLLTQIKSMPKQAVRTKKAVHRQLWPYGIAAAIALLIGVFVFKDSSTTLQTAFGEQTMATLPGGSSVTLNAKSAITYKKNSWNEERLLSLTGEALFKVTKGATFTVATDMGEITVLGTIFNVRSLGDMLEVFCYEGSVSVASKIETLVLTKGEAIRILPQQKMSSWTFLEPEPNWLSNESSFKSVPLKYVLAALEKQFNVTFETTELDVQTRFTGSFPHDNLDVALRTVLGPLQIDYLVKPNRTVILKL